MGDGRIRRARDGHDEAAIGQRRRGQPSLEDDRLSFRRFCGFGLDDGTPDETRLCRFRAALAERGRAVVLFAELNRQLATRGLMLKAGTLIDAPWARPPPARRRARARSPPRIPRPAPRGAAGRASSGPR
jgi:IS5 family transposase